MPASNGGPWQYRRRCVRPSRKFLSGQGLACRRGERLVFCGLDFSLAAGGALVLTGPNGSGKSSLLRLMAGLAPPEAGRLAADRRYATRRRIARGSTSSATPMR